MNTDDDKGLFPSVKHITSPIRITPKTPLCLVMPETVPCECSRMENSKDRKSVV